MHWGFLAWAVLGSLTAVALAHAHYVKGQPLQPRTLLYPVLGEKLMRGWLGGTVDALCVIAVVAGLAVIMMGQKPLVAAGVGRDARAGWPRSWARAEDAEGDRLLQGAVTQRPMVSRTV